MGEDYFQSFFQVPFSRRFAHRNCLKVTFVSVSVYQIAKVKLVITICSISMSDEMRIVQNILGIISQG